VTKIKKEDSDCETLDAKIELPYLVYFVRYLQNEFSDTILLMITSPKNYRKIPKK
jgi:hypothetical protein